MYIAVCEDHLGFRICLDEFLGKGNTGPVANSLAVTEELIPFGASKLGALAVVLGGQGIHPHEGIGGVLDGAVHHMIGVKIAEAFHGSTHG